MRHSLIGANSSDRDPFNPMRYFFGYNNHGYPRPSPIHRDDVENGRGDVENGGDDAGNDDNEDA